MEEDTLVLQSDILCSGRKCIYKATCLRYLEYTKVSSFKTVSVNHCNYKEDNKNYIKVEVGYNDE